MGNPLRQKIRENGLFLLLIGAFVVFLLPMVAMCFLALPAADDFSQMAKLREAMGSDWSLGNYIQNVWMLARETYFNIQGAFTIDVMIFLNPLGYNLSLYPVACLINFFATLVSVLVLSRCVVKYFLHSTWKNTIYLWMLAIFLLTQFIPLEETFYWYAGFIAYNLPLCLFMLLAAALIRMQFRKEKRPLFAAAACLLGFLIGGTNYPLALFSCCTLAVVLGINVLAKNRRQTLWALPVFLFLAAGFFINVVAPGNQERIEWYEQMHPAKAVFESFYFALDYLASWLTKTPILFFTLLCIPLMVRILSKTAFRFRLPGLVSLLVFCLYATLFTPGLYAMGLRLHPGAVYEHGVYAAHLADAVHGVLLDRLAGEEAGDSVARPADEVRRGAGGMRGPAGAPVHANGTRYDAGYGLPRRSGRCGDRRRPRVS